MGFQLIDKYEWFPAWKINLILGIDGLNGAMILLSGILGFAVALVSFNIKERVQEYYALALVSITGVFGLFMSVDLFFFILFYEMASVPMYFLVQMWGSSPRAGTARSRWTTRPPSSSSTCSWEAAWPCSASWPSTSRSSPTRST